MDHLALLAVDLDDLAVEQAAQLLEVPTRRRPRSAFLPSAHRAVAPVPKPHASRPGARSSIVAMADAVVITWRRFGTSTAVPTLMSVCSAMRASQIQMSS